jgi:hypothetical protein
MSIELGTLGVMSFPHYSQAIFHYLELPWLHNRPNVSCVPSGVYAGVRDYSPKFKREVYYLVGGSVVRDEEGLALSPEATRFLCIAGHPGNWCQDLQGCGAPGLTFIENHPGGSNGQRSHFVGSSVAALREIDDILEADPVIQVVIGWDV